MQTDNLRHGQRVTLSPKAGQYVGDEVATVLAVFRHRVRVRMHRSYQVALVSPEHVKAA